MSYRTLLENRPFRWFLVGGATSYAAPTGLLVVAVWISAVAYPADTSGKFAPLALVYLGLSAAIPTIVAAVFSGTIADRFNRRQLMLVTNAVATAATLAAVIDLAIRPMTPIGAPGLPGFYFPLYLLLLLPVWAIIAVATTLFRPAYNASLPHLIERAQLGSANGLVFALAVLLSIVASIGSTALLGTIGYATALLLPLVLFVVAQVSLRALPHQLNPERSGTRPSFMSDAKGGYLYLYHRRALLWITLGSLAVNFFVQVAFVELGVYATTWLHVTNPILYGLLSAMSYLGVAAGALGVPRLRFEPRSGLLIIVFMLGLGLSILAVGLLHSYGIVLVAMFLFGMFNGMIVTVFLAVVQATVPNDVLGRVLAADEVGSLALTPVGQYVGGVITVATSVQFAYLIAGAGSVIVAGAMALSQKLRHLGFEPDAQTSTPVPASPDPVGTPQGPA